MNFALNRKMSDYVEVFDSGTLITEQLPQVCQRKCNTTTCSLFLPFISNITNFYPSVWTAFITKKQKILLTLVYLARLCIFFCRKH